ncbi:uncharacterized protein [Nicotiana sylvestris]|uniref:uncharacterized protein n=1 Tax=Nicotiana sylvestris TaxID=4096 RepID=UPI00388C3E7E
MAKETGSEISFQDADNVDMRVEMVLSQGSGQGSNKRPHHSGRFSGASFGGRDSFGKGHPPRLFHLALQTSHGALGGRGSHMKYSDQQSYRAPSAPIRAPPIQSYSHGQLVRQGPSQFPQPQHSGGCFECASPEVEVSDAVITGTVLVCSRDASVLFDPRSTYFYVSSYFALYLVMPIDSLSAPIYVSTLVGNSIMVDHVHRSCIVVIAGLETRVDLLLLDMVDFDVILGMDWLSPYHAILDYHARNVTLALPGLPHLE